MHRLLLLAAVVFSACGGTSFIGSRYVKSQAIGAAGGTLTISATDDAQLANAALVVPPGALSDDVVITVERGLDDLSPGRAGPVLVLGPAGLPLRKAAKVVLPVTLDTRQRREDLFVSSRDGAAEGRVAQHAFDDSTGRVEFEVTELRAFQAIVASPGADGGVVACVTDDVCADHQDCINGACAEEVESGK
ncbi:MAG: hypothetical protein ACOZQL_37240 [Myxococcota bacterium]